MLRHRGLCQFYGLPFFGEGSQIVYLLSEPLESIQPVEGSFFFTVRFRAAVGQKVHALVCLLGCRLRLRLVFLSDDGRIRRESPQLRREFLDCTCLKTIVFIGYGDYSLPPLIEVLDNHDLGPVGDPEAPQVELLALEGNAAIGHGALLLRLIEEVAQLLTRGEFAELLIFDFQPHRQPSEAMPGMLFGRVVPKTEPESLTVQILQRTGWIDSEPCLEPLFPDVMCDLY
ncbi:MAG: hypothetical protein ACD_75C01375G0001 [uncultured bacterium]|nr:MAG: hypothetical protein ACD_75C01375G0001 [uncultured bacterium]